MSECKIVEDLLPLYEESLLQPETTAWLEQHVAQCPSCAAKTHVTVTPTIHVTSNIPVEQMMKRTQLKLSMYQLIFVALSFILAMSTTVFTNKGMHFIITYFLLGIITYYIYESKRLTFLLAFIPTALWTIWAQISSYTSVAQWVDQTTEQGGTIFNALFQMFAGALVWGGIHTLFTFLGILFVRCLQIAFKKGPEST